MGDQMDAFREKLNIEAARDAVPEMSPYEDPYYRSGPIVLSMFPRYLLIVFVLVVHVLFGIGYEAPEGEGGMNFLLNILNSLEHSLHFL